MKANVRVSFQVPSITNGKYCALLAIPITIDFDLDKANDSDKYILTKREEAKEIAWKIANELDVFYTDMDIFFTPNKEECFVSDSDCMYLKDSFNINEMK